MDLEKLKDYFPPDSISWRAGTTTADKKSCLPLAYIDARDVQDRLDEVVGPENWQIVFHDSPGGGIMCGLGIRIEREAGFEWVWKYDGADQTQFEAVKGGLSDAFKRSAVQWGVGRYLYGMKSPWVPCEQRGNSVAITKEGMQKLEEFLHGWYSARGVDFEKKGKLSKEKVDQSEAALGRYAKSLGFTSADKVNIFTVVIYFYFCHYSIRFIFYLNKMSGKFNQLTFK